MVATYGSHHVRCHGIHTTRTITPESPTPVKTNRCSPLLEKHWSLLRQISITQLPILNWKLHTWSFNFVVSGEFWDSFGGRWDRCTYQRNHKINTKIQSNYNNLLFIYLFKSWLSFYFYFLKVTLKLNAILEHNIRIIQDNLRQGLQKEIFSKSVRYSSCNSTPVTEEISKQIYHKISF